MEQLGGYREVTCVSNSCIIQPRRYGYPPRQGLYDPWFEKDACGVGFVVDIKGRKSHDIILQGIQIVLNLTHRGARGAEPNTGDGAGMLLQKPHKFFCKVAEDLKIRLPEAFEEYAVGMIFLPKDPDAREQMERYFERDHSAGFHPTESGPHRPDGL